MAIEKLITATLGDAMKAMAVGETRQAPDGYQVNAVRVEVAKLNKQGYLFQTSTRSGVQTITRFK